MYPQGFAAVFSESLSREGVYDAIKSRQTYATTKSRIYLDTGLVDTERGCAIGISAASEEGLAEAVIIRDGAAVDRLVPQEDPRVIRADADIEPLGRDQFLYVRVRTKKNNFAWSSPCWGAG